MADTRGTWSLSEAWGEKSADEWVPLPNVFVDTSAPQVTTAGYYIGGSTNSPYVAMSNIDKLTYANDTISTPPSASGFGRYTAPAPYNYYDNIVYSNNGAFALFTNWHINNTPSPAPVMYKHDFSTDDVTTVPSLAPVFPSAGGNGGAGTAETTWWHASTGSAGSYDAIKITYATESYAALPSGTGFSSNGLGSSTRIFQNQLVAGYTPASAPSNPGASQCKKLTFTTDTFTDNGWNLNSNRNGMAAVDAGSDDNTGLVAGGSSSPSPSNAVQKITLNNSTVSSAPSLSGGRYSGAAHSSGSSGSGYFSAMSSGGGPTAAISKVPFSSYSFSNIPATLSSIRRYCKGYSGLSKALKAGMSAPIERWFDGASLYTGNAVEFSGSTQYLQLSDTSELEIADSDFTMECWFYQHTDAGGGSNSHTLLSKWDNDGRKEFIWRISAHSGQQKLHWLSSGDGTENNCNIRGTTEITNNEWHHAAVVRESGNIYMWLDGELQSYTGSQSSTYAGSHEFMIGANGSSGIEQFFDGAISNVRFIKGQVLYTADFTITDKKLKESLTTTSQGATASNVKLLCCNQSTVTGSTVTPTDVTIETVGTPTVITQNACGIAPLAATPTSPTSLTGPEGIKAEGYLIQGIHGPTTSPTGRSDSYKLDYSTETWSSSANSTFIRKNGGATSTTTNAYIGGGTFGNVPSLGTNHGGDMDKYTYTTSTFSRIPGSDAGDIPGPAHANKQCAAGNQTQGYWAFGPAQSKCTKLTYSSETASNLPNLPWNAKNAVGVSKQTEGYYGSGDGFDDKFTSFVKITFSNDSYTAYTGWFLTPGGFGARYRCASSSSTKAYIVGGQNAPRCMDVTPWATNSTSNSPTTFLQAPGFYKSPGQGSNEAGYFTGGANTGNNGTNTEKITYASDTTAIVPSAYFPSSSPSGVNSYSTGGPNMNGLGTNTPNVI